jgi:hypothetical protein
VTELNPTSPTLQAVWAAYEAQPERPSNRIGISWLGEKCPRAMWYKFRWAARETFDGRMRRLFQRGHEEEIKVYADLLVAGLVVSPGPGHAFQLPEDQRTHANAMQALSPFLASPSQFPMHVDHGHIGGYADGACLGVLEAPKTWHMLEIKTHSDKSFNDLRTQGIEQAKPQHWVQCQVGMLLLGLERCLYIAVNKNTDDMIYTRVRLDRGFAERSLALGKGVVFSPTPPDKPYHNPNVAPCRWCPFLDFCHREACEKFPAATCRSCAWSKPVDGGGWYCQRHHKDLDIPQQVAACDRHLYIPEMLTGHSVIEASEDQVSYEFRHCEWHNGLGEFATPSKTLEAHGWVPF